MTVSILHASVPGRARLRVAGLGTAVSAVAVKERLAALSGVERADINCLTGSVLVHYRTSIDVGCIRDAIEECLGGESTNVATRPSRLSAGADGGDPARAWHATAAHEARLAYSVDYSAGLSAGEVARRRALHGPNELERQEPRAVAEILAEQLLSLPMILLGGSALISIATGGLIDAAAIAFVVVANAVIATTTERQAERTILSISQYDPTPVPVLRDGEKTSLPPADLVPGDVILLEPGTLAPADGRLVSAQDLTVNEAALTGESLPVHKDAEIVLREDTAIADRLNMIFRGTAVTGGRGCAVVTATGRTTEIGRVQSLLTNVRPPETPIQRQLGEVERELIIINGAICALVFGIGLARGHPLLAMLRSVISLAVASIPEGLPAIATTTLALGVQEMRKRDVLVRKLDAVEALGAAQVMALDKTGTLTENDMATLKIHVGGRLIDMADLAAQGGARAEDLALARRLFASAALSSQVKIAQAEGGFCLEGTPTEKALIQAGLDLGLDLACAEADLTPLELVPRAEGRKRVSCLLAPRGGGPARLAVKGDPVEVLARASHWLSDEGPRPLDAAKREAILAANQRMAGEALRILGVAEREGGDPRDEHDLLWLGLAGIANPIRTTVGPCLEALHGAGIRTVMITGDQSATAYAVARQLDLGDGHEIRVLEAGQTRAIDPALLAALAAQPHVFARVSPADKLQIVRALQARGAVVAMTGDGINDGPALRAADIGIAMGAGGTDVAREVADIVLATDDMSGIVEGVRLGRATYANMRKVLRFLIGTNTSESLVMLGASIAGWPEPLNPLQLLWLNLVTDVAPALSLALEPPEPTVLEDPPLDPKAPIFGLADFRHVMMEGALLGTVALGTARLMGGGAVGAAARTAGTITFHGLTAAQLIHAWSCRTSGGGLSGGLSLKRNLKLDASIAGGLALQALIQALPATRALFGLAPLGLRGVAGICGIVALSTLGNEVLDVAAAGGSDDLIVRSANREPVG